MNQETNDIWKPIAGFEGLYEISNQGQIRSLHCGTRARKKPIMMKPSLLGKAGYYRVNLMDGNGKIHAKRWHRLMAEAFIPNPLGLAEVNHKNGDRGDYRLENLEWMTRQENARHAFDTGLCMGKMESEIIREAYTLFHRDDMSLTDISNRLGLSITTVSGIAKRKRWALVTEDLIHLSDKPLAYYNGSGPDVARYLDLLVYPDGRIVRNGRELSPSTSLSGYPCVKLGSKHFMVHRLVAQCFVPNPHEFRCVHHIDNNRSNSQADNLVWCTHSYNISVSDAVKASKPRGERNAKSKLVNEQVIEIRARRQRGDTLRTLAQAFGVGETTIHSIVANQAWKHLL